VDAPEKVELGYSMGVKLLGQRDSYRDGPRRFVDFGFNQMRFHDDMRSNAPRKQPLAKCIA